LPNVLSLYVFFYCETDRCCDFHAVDQQCSLNYFMSDCRLLNVITSELLKCVVCGAVNIGSTFQGLGRLSPQIFELRGREGRDRGVWGGREEISQTSLKLKCLAPPVVVKHSTVLYSQCSYVSQHQFNLTGRNMDRWSTATRPLPEFILLNYH
jgi:hypothetical protein